MLVRGKIGNSEFCNRPIAGLYEEAGWRCSTGERKAPPNHGFTNRLGVMKPTLRGTLYVLLTLFLAGIVSTALAAPPQKSLGSLSGIVIGPNDKPVPHAVVTYQSSAGHGPHVVRANAKGRFYIGKLHWDNYDIRASAMGIFSEWRKNVTVRSGQDTSITLQLIYSKQPLRPAPPKQ